MLRKILLIVAALMVIVSNQAIATVIMDQEKWEQLPDLTPCGMDVMTTVPYALADDYLCTMTGRLTEISIWGSWYLDGLPKNAAGADDPSQVKFRIAILSDMPVGPDNDFSKPDELLWEKYFDPGTFNVEAPIVGEEGWYNPFEPFYEPVGDTLAFKYTFTLDPADTFIQQGTKDDPIIYWLGLQAIPEDEGVGSSNALFGWKTSLDHWNDDATYIEPEAEPDAILGELRYPDGHNLQGQSIDLAFSISGVPEPMTASLLVMGGLFALIRRRHLGR
ncbi:MAG: PEP-CTERM sorting domain-containing protein [Planctomycetes bacterium]|nr:PEP-CTERM sorting domain-containing protein [Planctomycetota bacterium]